MFPIVPKPTARLETLPMELREKIVEELSAETFQTARASCPALFSAGHFRFARLYERRLQKLTIKVEEHDFKLLHHFASAPGIQSRLRTVTLMVPPPGRSFPHTLAEKAFAHMKDLANLESILVSPNVVGMTRRELERYGYNGQRDMQAMLVPLIQVLQVVGFQKRIFDIKLDSLYEFKISSQNPDEIRVETSPSAGHIATTEEQLSRVVKRLFFARRKSADAEVGVMDLLIRFTRPTELVYTRPDGDLRGLFRPTPINPVNISHVTIEDLVTNAQLLAGLFESMTQNLKTVRINGVRLDQGFWTDVWSVLKHHNLRVVHLSFLENFGQKGRAKKWKLCKLSTETYNEEDTHLLLCHVLDLPACVNWGWGYFAVHFPVRPYPVVRVVRG